MEETEKLNFAYARAKVNDRYVYSIALIFENSFQLLPIGADTLEQLKEMLGSMYNSFGRDKTILDISFSPDNKDVIKLDSAINPLYVEKEE